MSKKTTKLPTAQELAFYRSKIADNSYIGKNQLAAVFAQLDVETARANSGVRCVQHLLQAATRCLAVCEQFVDVDALEASEAHEVKAAIVNSRGALFASGTWLATICPNLQTRRP